MRTLSCLAAAIATALIAAGCGGGSSTTTSSSSSSTPAATSAATTPTAPAATTSPSTSTSSGGGAKSFAEAAQRCHEFVNRGGITASAKAKIDQICGKIEAGDVAGAQKLAREACAEIVAGLPLPQATKTAVEAECNKIAAAG